MQRALEHARDGRGPAAIEAVTTRFYGHFEGDPQLYRAKDEVRRQRESMDCLKRFRDDAAAHGLTAAELDALDQAVLAEIDAAVAGAKAAAPPAEAELTTDVYSSY
jgi:pyruvate dehydrogenase E1 component alpha subunit